MSAHERDRTKSSSMCASCGKPIPPERVEIGSRTCRKGCFVYKRPYGRALPTGTTGAIAELAVAADLMRRGFAVFRALSSHCECDLVVLVNKRSIRVEVRSGYRNLDGVVKCPRQAKDEGRSDVYAIYLHDENLITYDPDVFALVEP